MEVLRVSVLDQDVFIIMNLLLENLRDIQIYFAAAAAAAEMCYYCPDSVEL